MSPVTNIVGGAARDQQLVADQTTTVRRTQLQSGSLQRVALLSEPTATYDARGSYPVYRLFQYAKPLPESRPFKGLDVSVPPSLFTGAYQRTASSKPSYIDRRL